MTECNEAPPTSLVMDRSTAYSQIIFNEVPKSYPPNVPLKCIYTVTAAIQPDRRDWVGIFKVGWNTTRDYYTFVWANSSSDPQKENQEKPHVLFDAYYLPKEDGEFYQFCYVDSAGQVRGASTPFCFKNPEDLNLQYSLENDLLVISTQAQVENEKEEFYEDVEAQKLTIEELKANLDEKLLEISLLKKSNAELSEEVSRLQQQQADREKEQIEQTLLKDDKRLEVKKEAERLVAQEDHLRMEDMQKENKELQQTLSTMKEKHEKAKTKINHLNNEREELKKKVKAQETEIAQLNSQVRELERERQQCREKQVRLQDQIQLLQVDLQSSQKDSVKLSGELRELRSHGKKITELQSENQLLHSSLLEKEQEKTRLQETNTQQLQEIQRFEEACSRAQRFQQELEEVKKQMGRQAVSLAEKDQFIKKLESQLMETRRGVEEQVCMVEIAQSEKEELSHENQKLRGDIQTLQRQLSDVETRQSPGAISLQNSNPYSPSRLCPSPEGSLASTLVYGNPFHSDGITTDEERVCRYCNEKFPGINLIELELHEQSHRMCPFCSLVCDSMEQSEFENHVYSHEEQE